jgi:parvulin-like peptidyl-prolyl isomerase
MKKICIIGIVLVLSVLAKDNVYAFPKSGSQKSHKTEKTPMSEEMREQILKSKDVVVAYVNGSPISMGDVLKMMNYVLSEKYNPEPDMKEIKKEALNRLILQELVYQKAKQEGIKIDKKRIDDSISGLKISLGGEEGFRRYLQNELTTEDELRKNLERRAVVEAKFKEDVLDRVSISDDEIRDYYKKNINRFKQEERMVVTDIVFILDTVKEESMDKAGEILKRLKADPKKNISILKDQDFLVVRELEIKDEKDRLREAEIYKAAKGLKPGEISDVIKMSDSIHILILKEHVAEKEFSFGEVKDFILNELKNDALIKRIREWEHDLKKDAKIEIIEVSNQ